MLQDRLIEAGKLSTLGRLSAGIAHELNTPLGAIISSSRNVAEYMDTLRAGDHIPERGHTHSDLFSDRELELFTTLYHLGMLQSRTLNMQNPTRTLKRQVAARLDAEGVPNSAKVAVLLIELGVSDTLDALLPLLHTPRNLEVLEAVSAPVGARLMVEIITESGRRAAGVVDALRSYVSEGSTKGLQRVDLNESIRKVLALMHNILKHGVQLQTSFAEDVQVGADPDKLSQVWMNLIRNAIQAMNLRGRLEIVTNVTETEACVSFIDNGKGIPAEDIDRIFETFYTTKEHGEGLGLGLDICRQIIQTYNGRITVSSVPGRTEFCVLLPVFDAEKEDTGVTTGDTVRG
ncbi:MAG: sensor histidine kinase, partial [Spirochaeta sp.]